MIADHFQSAERAFQLGDLDRASKLCAQILKESPRHAPSTLLSGLIEVRQGQSAQAVQTLKRALELSPNDYIGLAWLQLALRNESRFQEAIEVGERARALWPDDPEVLVGLSYAYLGRGQIDKAAECLAQAAVLQPRNAAIRRRLGAAYELLGRDNDAAEELRRSIKLAPGAEDGYIRLGRLLIGHGNFTQVLELCEGALRILPQSAQIHLLLAQAYRGVRDDELAQQHLQTAVSLDPNIVISAAMWLQEDGKFGEAAELFERSIEQRPEQGVAYFGLVKGRKVTAADEELLNRMERNLEIPGLPLAERAALHYGLGKAANDLRDYERAMRHFDEGNRLNYQIYIAGKGFDSSQLERNRKKIEAMFTQEFLRRHRSVGSDSDVPIFIVGMIRSGTTLVEQIISSHRDVGGAGEQRFWINEIPKVVDLDGGTLDFAMLSEVQDRYLQVLRSFQPDSPRITDKMPMNFYCAGLIHLAYPNSPIVHIQRNPVDTALSIYMTDLARPPEFAHNKENIVAEYRDYLAMMRHWRKVLPADRLLEVRYEDLIADQEFWTRRMLDFCGLDWDPQCLEFHANERPVSTPSNWQVRQPIYRSSVERWRNYEPWLGAFAELLETEA
jgi:tetratricopeptide (TPR) repeat protein